MQSHSQQTIWCILESKSAALWQQFLLIFLRTSVIFCTKTSLISFGRSNCSQGGGGFGSRQHWPMGVGAYMTSDEQVERNGSHEVVTGEFFSWLRQSPALAYGRRRLCTICTCKQNKHNATTPLASSQLHQARLSRLARLSSLARLCRLARLSSLARLSRLARLLLVFWPVDEDVRTAGPVLALFTLPVLVCKHVNQVARQWVTLLDEPARLIGTVLATYKPTANHRLHN